MLSDTSLDNQQSKKKNRSVLLLLLFLPLLCSTMFCVSVLASGLYFPNNLSDIAAASTADYAPWSFIRVLPIDVRLETEVFLDTVSRETPIVITDEAGNTVTPSPVIVVSNPIATATAILVAANATETATPNDVETTTPSNTETVSPSETPVASTTFTETPTLTATLDPSTTPTETATVTLTATPTTTPLPTSTDTPVPTPPIANFTVALNGLTVTPTNVSTGTITSYSWTFGDGVGTNALANPSSYTYATAGTYTITLTVTGPGGSNTATSTVVVAPPVPQSTDLSVGLVASNPSPQSGETITITATIRNNTGTTATGVTANLNFESGLTYQGYSGGGTFDGTTWNVGILAANSTVSMQMSVLANTGGASPRISLNLATVSPFDNNASNNSATIIIVTQSPAPVTADVALGMNVNPTTANIGDSVAYTLTATNNGPLSASNVTITQTLPTGITFVSSPNCTAVGQIINCGLGTLSNGTSSSVTVNAQISQSGTLTSTASVNASESDSNTSNNNASASVAVNAVDVDLNLGMSVSSNTPAEGSTVTYTVTLSNNGANPATNIGINVALPSSVTFILNSTSSGTYNAGTGRWTIPSLGVGNSVTLTLITSVNNGTSGTTTTANANTVALSENDPTPASANVDITPTVATSFTDLRTTLSGPSGTVSDNSDLYYTAIIINNSAFTATNIVATVNISPSISLSAISGDSTFDGSTNTWTIGTLTSGQDARLNFRIRVSSSQGHSVVTTSVSPSSFDQSDYDLSNNVASRTVNVTNPGINLSKSVNNGNPNIGQTVVYRVRLRNRDVQNYTGVQVTDNLPAGVTYVSHTVPRGTFDFVSGIWNVGTINVGEQLDLNITVRVDNTSGGQRITNTASITAFNETDPTPGNNTDSAQINVNTAGFTLDKSVNTGTPLEGSNITYTITLRNRDTITYTSVQATDFLPTGVTFVSSSPDQGTYDPVSGIWNIPTVSGGATVRLRIVVQVNAGTAGTTISNQTNLVASTPAIPAGSDTFGQANIQPIANPLTNLSISLDDLANPDPVFYDEGDSFQLRIVVRNNGPQNATNIVAQLNVPPQVTFVSSSSGSYDSATGIWTVGNLNSGQGRGLNILFSINTGTAGQSFTFNGTITSYDQTDPDTSNNSGSESFTVSGTDLGVVKTVDNNIPNEGDTITYTLVVSNTGRDATDVRVTDNLPVGVTYVSHTPSVGTFDNATGEWIIGDMLDGTSAQLDIVATVDTGTVGGTITNTATISNFTQIDTNSSNNFDSAVITPQ